MTRFDSTLRRWIKRRLTPAALAIGLHGCQQGQPPGPTAPPATAATSASSASSTTTSAPAAEWTGGVERLDPALDALVAPDARVEVLARGFEWAEGPVWTDRALLFSDVPNNVIEKWQPVGGIGEFLRPSGYTGTVPRGGEPGSNGLAVDGSGRLYLCQHGDRRIAVFDSATKSFTTVADRYDGKRFNSPNDLVVRPNGDVYFTDPIYGLEGHDKDPKREMPWSGVYRATPAGKVQLLDKEETFPNGIAFSPDGKTMYVSSSDPARAIWVAFDVTPAGGVTNRRVFFDATDLVKAGKKGLPDGMKVDARGNIFGAGPGGILVFSPEGRHLGTIVTGEPTSNCAFGDDGHTLYMTAHDKLVRIRLRTQGFVSK